MQYIAAWDPSLGKKEESTRYGWGGTLRVGWVETDEGRMGEWCVLLGWGVYTLCVAAGGRAHMGGGIQLFKKNYRCCRAAAPEFLF